MLKLKILSALAGFAVFAPVALGDLPPPNRFDRRLIPQTRQEATVTVKARTPPRVRA